jgi:hypothetical protein
MGHTWDDILDEASLHPWNQAAHNMWLRLAKGLQFCNMRMSFSPVLCRAHNLSWRRHTQIGYIRVGAWIDMITHNLLS